MVTGAAVTDTVRPTMEGSLAKRRCQYSSLITATGFWEPSRSSSGVKTRPEMDVRRKGERPGEFVSDVAKLVQRVEEFGARDGNLPWPRHPLFGALNDSEWKRWAYLHTDHHLRQFSA